MLYIYSTEIHRITKLYKYSALMSVNQFGFMRGRSTVHVQQLLLLLHSVLEAISNKQQLDDIYFDIKKAFDSVSHSILLSKLKNFGISGQCFNFVSSYLYNRLQCV